MASGCFDFVLCTKIKERRMLTVEEYILQMKKKDKLDEFNFKNHAENMSAVISYVMEYFDNYLDPEAYDYEKVKTEQVVLK